MASATIPPSTAFLLRPGKGGGAKPLPGRSEGTMEGSGVGTGHNVLLKY